MYTPAFEIPQDLPADTAAPVHGLVVEGAAVVAPLPFLVMVVNIDPERAAAAQALERLARDVRASLGTHDVTFSSRALLRVAHLLLLARAALCGDCPRPFCHAAATGLVALGPCAPRALGARCLALLCVAVVVLIERWAGLAAPLGWSRNKALACADATSAFLGAS